MNNHRNPLLLLIAVIVGGSLAHAAAEGATFQWSNPNGGRWEDTSNWVPRGYPRFFFDIAVFGQTATYQVDASDAALIQGLGIIHVPSGDVTLMTHDSFRAVIGVGTAGSPASLALKRGAITGSGMQTIGPAGTLILEPGTRIECLATGPIGFALAAGGMLRGDGGSMENHVLENSGTVSPGLAPGMPGALAIGTVSPGGYVQRESGVLEIEIGGTTPGTGYDQLRVERSDSPATLNGTLRITLIEGFAPRPGDRFEVLIAPSITGTFSSEILPASGGSEFSVVYEPTAVVVVAAGAPPAIAYGLDIKPGTCPNPLNPRQQGVVPAALRGTPELDVHAIDVSSLRLEGVAPERWDYEDVSAATSGESCDCTGAGADGILDLTLKFPAPALLAAIGPVERDDERQLTLSGALLSGESFTASDCVRIVGGGEGSGRLKLAALTSAWERHQIVSYDLPATAEVRISIFNVSGRKVAEVFRAVQATGEHAVEWDASGIPSGIYYYRLEAGGLHEATKLMLFR